MDLSYITHNFKVKNIGEIQWAHAVNSKQLLSEALSNETVHFVETDVNLSPDGHIVMNHEFGESDLSLEDLLATTSQSKKGLKLDFKHPDVVESALKTLSEYQLSQPIILNADVMSVENAPPAEIYGPKFIELCNQYYPDGLLSLGWRTTLALDSKYAKKDIDEMLQLCEGIERVTFPVRASMLPRSWEQVSRLLSGESTLTIWDSEAVDDELYSWLLDNTDPQRCFYDIRMV